MAHASPPPWHRAGPLRRRLGEELGRGAFGQVFRGLDTRTGEHVAIKQLSLERLSPEQLQGIMNEVELLRNLAAAAAHAALHASGSSGGRAKREGLLEDLRHR